MLDELPHQARDLGLNLGLSPSSHIEVRFARTADFAHASWQAYTASGAYRGPTGFRKGDRIWVQARDAAGNVSSPESIQVADVAETLLDRAVTLEQEAIVATREAAMKKRLRQSIARVKEVRRVARQAAPGTRLLASIEGVVERILTAKLNALQELRLHRVAEARALVRTALLAETDLIPLLDELQGPEAFVDIAFAEDQETE